MIRLCSLVLAGLIASAGPSLADSVTSFSPQTIAAALTLKSYTDVAVTTDGSGDPLISGTADGVPFNVVFYSCVDHKNCPDVLFSATLAKTPAVTPEKMNEWNAGFVWPAKVTQAADGTPKITSVLYFEPGGGMPYETFAANFAAFVAAAQHAANYFK